MDNFGEEYDIVDFLEDDISEADTDWGDGQPPGQNYNTYPRIVVLQTWVSITAKLLQKRKVWWNFRNLPCYEAARKAAAAGYWYKFVRYALICFYHQQRFSASGAVLQNTWIKKFLHPDHGSKERKEQQGEQQGQRSGTGSTGSSELRELGPQPPIRSAGYPGVATVGPKALPRTARGKARAARSMESGSVETSETPVGGRRHVVIVGTLTDFGEEVN